MTQQRMLLRHMIVPLSGSKEIVLPQIFLLRIMIMDIKKTV